MRLLLHTRHRKRILAAVVVASAVVALAVTVGAWAYWTSSGTGSGSVSTATLGAPTSLSATAGIGGTVALTWSGSAVNPPGPGTVEYYVEREGPEPGHEVDEPGGSCPTKSHPKSQSELPNNELKCTDEGVSIGTYHYTVTAKWRSWTAPSGSTVATVTIGPITHFLLAAASTTPTASAADNLTITAKDASNNTVGTYTGLHNLTFEGAGTIEGHHPTVTNSSGTAKPFPESTAITFTSGVATVSGSSNGVMTLYKTEPASIKVKEGSKESNAVAVTVSAASAYSFSVPTASTHTAGEEFSVTLTALDAYGNTATSYTGLRLLKWYGPGASPSPRNEEPIYPATATEVTFSNGVGTATGIELYDAQSTTLNATEEGGSIEGTSGFFTVAPAAVHSLSLSAVSTHPTAGATDNLTITALDTYENTVTSYGGAGGESKSLTFAGPEAIGSHKPTITDASGAPKTFLTESVTIKFKEGEASHTTTGATGQAVMTLYKAQTKSLTVTDGTHNGSLSITVSGASAKSFSFLTAIGEKTAGTAFLVQNVDAKDEYGNIAPSYAGTKTLTWTVPANSPSGHAPEYPTTVTFTGGVATYPSITLYDAQSTTLTATEGSMTGTSNSFTVKAAAASHLAWTGATQSAGTLTSPCLFTCADTALGNSGEFKAKVSVTDNYGNIVSALGSGHTVEVTVTPGGILSPTPPTDLTIPSSGAATSAEFTFTSQSSESGTDTLNANAIAGTPYIYAEANMTY